MARSEAPASGAGAALLRIAAFGRCILTRGDSDKPNAARVLCCAGGALSSSSGRAAGAAGAGVQVARDRQRKSGVTVGIWLGKTWVWRQARQAISTEYPLDMSK
jgi:hypothetical protein